MERSRSLLLGTRRAPALEEESGARDGWIRGQCRHSPPEDKWFNRHNIHYAIEQMNRTFDPVQLGSIEVFCKAAELGSFTAASGALGLTPASVSRCVGRLERRLGVRLFTRTTRSVRLTEDGELYRAQCQAALEQIAEVERAITGRQLKPKGLLRVSVGTVYGHHRLMPLLPAFMQAHPGVEVEVNVSNRNIDFVDDGYDLAIRVGEPGDSRLVARKLEDAPLGVYASPDYLARQGIPRSIEDLGPHDLIQFVHPDTGRPMPWRFEGEGGKELMYAFKSRQRIHDDLLAGLHWAIAGGGLFQVYRFVAQRAVRSGRLVEVLKRQGSGSRPIYVLYPQNRHLSARVRAFIDHLTGTVNRRSPAPGNEDRKATQAGA